MLHFLWKKIIWVLKVQSVHYVQHVSLKKFPFFFFPLFPKAFPSSSSGNSSHKQKFLLLGWPREVLPRNKKGLTNHGTRIILFSLHPETRKVPYNRGGLRIDKGRLKQNGGWRECWSRLEQSDELPDAWVFTSTWY